MIELDVPAAVRICEACGDMAHGEGCATCERLGELYDARYHARRAAELFGSLPREQEVIDDGLGAMRAAATGLKWTAIAALAIFLLGVIFGGLSG